MYDKNNIFARIIRKEIPSKLLYEDEIMIAFNDINPVAPVHVLVVPKGEFKDYTDFVTNAPHEVQITFFQNVAKIAKSLCDDNFKLCTNNGPKSGQTVFHFHVHIIGGGVFVGDKLTSGV
jgi:diadenosine tetraphosphate (Ap4A) HIT family hydrolase